LFRKDQEEPIPGKTFVSVLHMVQGNLGEEKNSALPGTRGDRQKEGSRLMRRRKNPAIASLKRR